MATPSIRQVVGAKGVGVTSLSTTSATAIDDWLIAIQEVDYVTDTDLVAPTGTAGTWTQIGTGALNTNIKMRAWRRKVTTNAAQTVTVSQGGNTSGNHLIVYVLDGADLTNPIDGTPTTATGASGTAQAVGATSPSSSNALLIAAWAGIQFSGTITYTAPGTMIERDEEAFNTAAALMSASQVLSSSGSTGTRTATASISATSGWVAMMFAVQGVALVTKTATDSGTGTDTITSLARTSTTAESGSGTEATAIERTSAVTDAGTGADVTDVLRASSVADSATGAEIIGILQIVAKSVSDSATGTEQIVVDVPVLKSLSDSATGTEQFSVLPVVNIVESGTGTEATTVARTSSLAETAAGTDSTAVLRSSSIADTAAGTEQIATVLRATAVADVGTGTETVAIMRISAMADTAAGVDIITGSGPFVHDSGVGTEDISVVIIPFTLVLRRPTEPIVYDLVVLARIPQSSGPPTFVEVDPIEWKTLTYSNTLGEPQELTATCQLSSITEGILQRFREPHALATELQLTRNGRVVFVGPLLGGQSSGETLTLQAQGLLAYLRRMVIAQDLKFVGSDQFTIVKSMVDQWQSLEYGNYGIDTSGVTTSGNTRDAAYLRDELHNVGVRVSELGKSVIGFDAEVDPVSRRLQLWSPGKGVDRSTGEDAIVFDGRNVTSGDILFSVAPGDLASEGFATSKPPTSDTTLYSTVSNLELRAQYGRCGITNTYSDISEMTVLDAANQGAINARQRVLLLPGPKVRVTPDADLPDYSEGDTVSYEVGGRLGVTGAFRIRKRTVNAEATGQESVDLEFV